MFIFDLGITKSQKVVKIEKKERSEEGIDCIRPVIWEPMVAVTKPNLKNIKTSFIDAKSQELIVVSDKIYFIKLKDFVTHATPKDSEKMVFDAESISRLLPKASIKSIESFVNNSYGLYDK